MDTRQAKKTRHSNFPLPEEVVIYILSFLPVKSLMRLSCGNKLWNTLLYNPIFIKNHLHKSQLNPHLTLFSSNSRCLADCSVIPIPVHDLILNQPFTLPHDDPCNQLKDKDCCWVVGSCKGLICLFGFSPTLYFRDIWFCLWNPATRTVSKKFGFFRDFKDRPLSSYFKYSFGCDNATNTYKVVLLHFYEDDLSASWRTHRIAEVGENIEKALWWSEVMVISLDDNDWRGIQSLPGLPLRFEHQGENDGVYLNDTLNWVALGNNFSSIIDWNTVTTNQFVIISLDLGTEKYSQLKSPQGFDEVPSVEPIVCVLNKCLCFSYTIKRTDFVIWKMTEFGMEESWILFLKISYENVLSGYNIVNMLGNYKFQLLPLCLSRDGDTLILTSNLASQAILYNWRENRAEKVRITNGKWWTYVKDHVESLVLTS